MILLVTIHFAVHYNYCTLHAQDGGEKTGSDGKDTHDEKRPTERKGGKHAHKVCVTVYNPIP